MLDWRIRFRHYSEEHGYYRRHTYLSLHAWAERQGLFHGQFCLHLLRTQGGPVPVVRYPHRHLLRTRFISRSLQDAAWTQPIDWSDYNTTHPRPYVRRRGNAHIGGVDARRVSHSLWAGPSMERRGAEGMRIAVTTYRKGLPVNTVSKG